MPLRYTACAALFASAACGAADDTLEPLTMQDRVLRSSDFRNTHPDLRYRTDAMHAYDAGDFADALALFRRAARYADKPAQAMIADILWHGRGVAPDRAQAYVWMDLAAERAYPAFLSFRERYWTQMTAEERRRALHDGPAFVAEYGDAVAQERMEHVLRKRRMDVGGSRAGNAAGTLKVYVFDLDGRPMRIPAFRYYDPRYWQPRAYYAWQDAIWGQSPAGRVEVGPLRASDAQAETP